MSATTAGTAIRQLADLPAPRGLPLLGNLLQLDVPRLHLVFEDWCRRLGSPYRLQLAGKAVYVSADPDLLQAVLRERPERFRRVRQIQDCLAELGGNGVFSAEGEAWRPQRKLVMSSLNATHFRGFFPTLAAITQRLHRRWQAAAIEGRTVEMTQDLVRYTVDVTTALAFGEDPNTLERDGDVIQDHLALVFPMIMERINAPFPYWRWIKLPRDHRFDRAMAAIQRHTEQLIVNARQRLRDAPASEPRNVLEAMLRARDEPHSGVSDADVHANVLTLLLAGEDTTAHTLGWTLFQLAQHPQWQQRLQGVADEVLGAAAVCASYEDVRRLDLFEATANEATRLKPIVPLVFLEPNEDVVLDGTALPRGTPMFFLLRPAMMDDARFADAATFDPGRWSAGHHPERAHDTRAYMQFGAGPRVCPGRHLAGVEIRLVLSMLARHFNVELAVDPDSIREVAAFTMMPSAMPMRLLPRPPG
ncbi:MAG TPA: cytochrome P450 [Methylibium sp.]|nr:cytochrome P450 [Methylibium sp.]